MTTYPHTLSEEMTLSLVSQGRSIARFGDGEFTVAENRACLPQGIALDLAARLRGILRGEGGECLVGIPNIHSPTPKAAYWEKYKRCAVMLNPDVSYVSSFITRPDSAPWLDVPSYWRALEDLWTGRDVTLVRGTNPKGFGGVSLQVADLKSARSVREVVGPPNNAWSLYSRLMEQIGTPPVALLCLGPTATVMAVDLCKKGVHAIDMGHAGMFLHRHQQGLPMKRTRAEKAMAI